MPEGCGTKFILHRQRRYLVPLHGSALYSEQQASRLCATRSSAYRVRTAYGVPPYRRCFPVMISGGAEIVLRLFLSAEQEKASGKG